MAARRYAGAYYNGIRVDGLCEVWVTYDNHPMRELPRVDFVGLADGDGWEWGDLSVESHLTAVCILYDATGSELHAREFYRAFTREIMQRLHHDSWVLNSRTVQGWLMDKLHEKGRGYPVAN